jgi:hypothetical protein
MAMVTAVSAAAVAAAALASVSARLSPSLSMKLIVTVTHQSLTAAMIDWRQASEGLPDSCER